MNNLWRLIGILCVFFVYKPLGVSSYGEEKCDYKFILNLNERIKEAISKYPELPLEELRLTMVHNTDCRLLSNLYIKYPGIDKAECEKIEQFLVGFLEKAAENYEVIPLMVKAVKDLLIIQEDPLLPEEVRSEAFKLRVNIKFSASPDEAKEFLQKFEDFRKEYKIVPREVKQDEQPSKEA